MAESLKRKPHAVMNLPSRQAKGMKIERLLDLAARRQPIRMLDIGTGNGGIAHYFASHPAIECEVTSVDLVDQRLVSSGYRFLEVSGPELPFEDGCFDVVLTNHVIEHVGGRRAQFQHLDEVRRVLATDGVAYLAVPNRWMIVEPHYKLPFLSWLPRRLRSPYLRFFRKGAEYDCEPLTTGEVADLLSGAGLEYCHLHIESIRVTLEIEGAHGFRGWIEKMPDTWLNWLRYVNPTLIYRLTHDLSRHAR